MTTFSIWNKLFTAKLFGNVIWIALRIISSRGILIDGENMSPTINRRKALIRRFTALPMFSGKVAMWRMLQQEKAEDFIIATGEAHSLEEFVKCTFDSVGLDGLNVPGTVERQVF